MYKAACAVFGLVVVASWPHSVLASPAQAEPTPPADPDYGILWGYFWILIPAVAAAMIGVAWARRGPLTKLPGITKDWSFDDSFATNAGLAVVLFTGIFASTDVLEAVLGSSGRNAVALAAVGSAISAGVIGSAPVLLTILVAAHGNEYHVYAVAFASVAVLVGNGGLILVMHQMLTQSDVVSDGVVTAGAWVAGVLLFLFGMAALYRTIDHGKNPPGPGMAATAALV